jgi:LmbE family N-acetylglucosaminyl deacetylase
MFYPKASPLPGTMPSIESTSIPKKVSMKTFGINFFQLALLMVLGSVFNNPAAVQAQILNYEPRILIVTAHPDDEAVFAATVFKTTRLLDGTVDLALITNGEGGYRYSTLGNYIYGLPLDEEKTGRAKLPEIRKKELKEAGKVLGLNEYFFLDQKDDAYSNDVRNPLSNWEADRVQEQLESILREGGYDFIFTMLPVPETHAHHQAATLLALRAVQDLEPDHRPIVLGRGWQPYAGNFEVLEGYPVTRIDHSRETLKFDRSQKFGYEDRLDYTIIARWVVAAHKSQGTAQMLPVESVETFYYFSLNPDSGYQKAKEYFEAVNEADIDNR